MPPHGASWYGELMQVHKPQARAKRRPASAVRSVTVLGATGSVGMSTVDLLKRGNGKYSVEAVTANKNAAHLAQIARDLSARIAVVADPKAYRELKEALEYIDAKSVEMLKAAAGMRGRTTGTIRQTSTRR